jgi:hypothetical protein
MSNPALAKRTTIAAPNSRNTSRLPMTSLLGKIMPNYLLVSRALRVTRRRRRLAAAEPQLLSKLAPL